MPGLVRFGRNRPTGRPALVARRAHQDAGGGAIPTILRSNRADTPALKKPGAAPLAFEVLGNAGKADAAELLDDLDA